MFTNLKVWNDSKGLKVCLLSNLGKVNVICGKNNAGKSTLLEGIEKYKFTGKQSKEDIIAEVSENILQGLKVNPGTLQGSQYRAVINDVMKERTIWFAENQDLIKFINSLQTLFTEINHGLPVDSNIFTAVYNKSIVTDNEKIVLIPTKRILETTTNVNSGQVVSPTGEGILNYLFYAKNRQKSTEDKLIYNRILEAFNSISSGYTFDITMNKSNLIMLSFSYDDQAFIDADACGLGLQDLLVVLYYSIHPNFSIVLIEEPECHIHPDMQRRLLLFFKEKTSKQFFLTTHSNVFLNNALVDRVFFTRFSRSVEVDDATSRAIILNQLGYTVTDNLVSDLIILIEGPSDKPVIEEFLIKFNLFGLYDIKIWPLGGDNMGQVDLSVFAQKYSIIALIDKDPKSNSTRNKFIKNCEQYNIPVTRLKRYAIENYFSVRALKAVFQGQISSTLTAINPDKKLEDQIGMDVKKKNWNIAHEMFLEEIENTDFYTFLEKIKELCSANKN